MNILVVKNENCIIISNKCKKLLISNTENLYKELIVLTNDEIIQWYLEEKRGE